MRNSRRRFLKGLSLAVVAPRLGPKDLLSETKKIRLPIAFSTLGCPSWEWKKTLDFASQHGFAAVELHRQSSQWPGLNRPSCRPIRNIPAASSPTTPRLKRVRGVIYPQKRGTCEKQCFAPGFSNKSCWSGCVGKPLLFAPVERSSSTRFGRFEERQSNR